ncbi:MAG: hypothetical protein VKJ04_08775 [Vampirovibrionales bacterium]|nr:hypothetical protein [Vampirovibrionales bacterium]
MTSPADYNTAISQPTRWMPAHGVFAVAAQTNAPVSTLSPQHPGDAFERALSDPTLQVNPTDQWGFTLKHPIQAFRLKKLIRALPNESQAMRVAMYQKLFDTLDRPGKANLQSLLKRDVLDDARTDDGHSTLYQLYGMLTTQRAPGFHAANLVQETLRILNRPYYITQKFDTLSESAARQILHARNNFNLYLNRVGELPPAKRLGWEDINVINSAECVPSSIMYSMADQYPAELARELRQLTSPLQGFYRKVQLRDLSPEKPDWTYQILQNHQIHYVPGEGESVWVKVELPAAGLIRAIDSNRHAPIPNVRTGVEAAYQSALTFLATRSYDPATDLRDSEIPGEGSKGLTEMEKTLIESIIKGNGGVASVTYQVVAGKVNPQQGEEGTPFLYGYTRTFEQTAGDIIDALRMKQFVIIGITDTETSGAIAGGHEITITSAFVDPVDRELKFYVIDSDDDIDKPVVRSARELIPKIHHAGMPWALAKKIQNEITAIKDHYYVTDAEDLARFDTLAHIQDRLPKEAVSPAIVAPATEEVPDPNPAIQTPANISPFTVSPQHPLSNRPSAQVETLAPEIAYDDPTPLINPSQIHTHWEPMPLYQPSSKSNDATAAQAQNLQAVPELTSQFVPQTAGQQNTQGATAQIIQLQQLQRLAALNQLKQVAAFGKQP